MPVANQSITLYSPDTISADTTTDSQEVLNYNELVVYLNVNNGPAGSETLDVKLQTCDEDSTDDDDWVDLTPDDGSGFTQITGSAGGNAWPDSQVKKYSTFHKYVRGFIDISSGSWTVELQIVGRQG